MALTETAGALRILGALSLTGSVQLITTDTAAAGEDVIVLLGGPVLSPRTRWSRPVRPNDSDHRLPWRACGPRVNVTILAGDNVIAGADRSGAQPLLTYIVAGAPRS